MPRGRKPKPTNQKLLEGNPGKRPLPEGEPQTAVALPECPPWLDAEARAEWERIGAHLLQLRLISPPFVAMLAQYCVAWSRWRAAEAKIDETGGAIVVSPSGFPVQNPYLAVANKAMKQLKDLATEFGLSPSSITRVKALEAATQTALTKFSRAKPRTASPQRKRTP